MQFSEISKYKINKENTDSFDIVLKLKEYVSEVINIKKFSSLNEKFSEITGVPFNAIKKKNKQILMTSFNYKNGKFNENLKIYKIFFSAFQFLSIVVISFFLRKKFLTKINANIILTDVDSIRDYERYSLLLDKFDNSVVFFNYNNEIQTDKINENKVRFFNLKKTNYLNHNFFEKKYLKLIIFLFQLFFTSIYLKFNFIHFYSILLFSSCKNYWIFQNYKSKYLIQDRFYRTCPIRNFFFKKYGGVVSCCTQKNIIESCISCFIDIDIFFSLGDEKESKNKLIKLGGRVGETYPVGSMFMEHDWYRKKNDNLKVLSSDVLILGLNPNTWMEVNNINNKNYNKIYLEWIKNLSLDFPDLKILIKHHNNLSNNDNEISFFKGTKVKSVIKTESKNYSYGFLEKSKIAFSFGSTMILEGIGDGKKCFFIDPKLKSTCFFEGLKNLDILRISNYVDFKKIIVKYLFNKNRFDLDNIDKFCLKSDKVSEKIFNYLLSKQL